ncbi:MAG: FecR domain-containing protein [Prevotella sp.]|nr:FecR domain-containing protein [Prevotella sp.]
MENIEAMDREELEKLLADQDVRQDISLLAAVEQSYLRHRYPAPDTQQMWEQFEAQHITPIRERRKYRLRVISAAVLSAAAVLLCLFLFHKSSPDVASEEMTDAPLMAFTRDTTPQVIRFSDEKGHEQVIDELLAKESERVNDLVADFSVSSSVPHDLAQQSDASMVGWKTIRTPRGKVYKVILPDKTQVLMNADSKLTFPDRFEGSERVVKLEGEAFFSVTKDAHHPFVVESEKLRTHVLGTEFNLRAYPNSNPHVTLVSGQVQVDNLLNHQTVMMKPGQDVTIDRESNFDVSTVDTEYYVQWKEGFFYFDNLPLVEVLRELGRWYNVDIQITDNSLMSYRLHFIADRGANIDQVVNNLNGFSYLSVERRGECIIVSKKKHSSN